MKVIGRLKEKGTLEQCASSDKPTFLVVYGRRRVGKTFLIRETFSDRFCFHFTGNAGVSTSRQLARFDVALKQYGKDLPSPSSDWFEAFDHLRSLIEASPITDKKIVFLDEMPWMDTPRSGFLAALEAFWNGWASARPDLMLIACGSATSWITNKVLHNRGGLHNRVTQRMSLQPFSLAECEEFFTDRRAVYSRDQILELYMAFGGIPYYLDLCEPAYSIAQNIDSLYFHRTGALADEYISLYSSLFAKPERYMDIVEALATRLKGLTRSDISRIADFRSGGSMTRVLNELEQCGFIRNYQEYGKQKKDALYQLIDPFTLFHLRFSKIAGHDEDYWTHNIGTGILNAWHGYAFEMTCLTHIDQIKAKLGISGVATSIGAWRSTHSTPGTQIDLVIDRRDGIVNLCEMKYASKPYTVTRAYDAELAARRATFQEETSTRSAVHITLVATQGLTTTSYRSNIQSEITLDDLYAPAT